MSIWAVVKLAQPAHTPIAINTQKPLVGDVVLAIGNSFGVGQAVTQGIISGLGRTNLGLANIENFIQTDVAINPGKLRGGSGQYPGRADWCGHRRIFY